MAFMDDFGELLNTAVETIPGIINAAGNLKKPGLAGTQPTIVYQQLPPTPTQTTPTTNTALYIALAFMFLLLMMGGIFLFTRKSVA